MTTPKEPVRGTADGGIRGTRPWRSEAERLEEAVEAAEWREEETRRVERARRRLAELAGSALGLPPATLEPLTPRAREALPKLRAVLDGLKAKRQRRTKTAVATGLDIDRATLDTWIANGWVTWPPDD